MASKELTSTLFPLCLLIFYNVFNGCYSSGNVENVALHKECNMSSKNADTGINNAVNGNTGGIFGVSNCIHTALIDSTPWWEVNLGRPYPIYNITIFARATFECRMRDCVVSVDGTECYRFGSEPNRREMPISCTRGVINGRVIRVSKSTALINICEFQVFSCSDTYWGNGCNTMCGNCSGKQVCDKVTGHCPNCNDGWEPPLCSKECPEGTFGFHCSKNCSAHCRDICDKTNGHCKCQPGYVPSLCTSECRDGFFGQDCALQCGDGCNDTCDKVSGSCTCKPGWQPGLCDSQCSDGFFGQDCARNCSVGCDDTCDKESGHCTCKPGWLPEPLCNNQCSDGFFGQDCAQNCSEGCDDTCDKVSGHCTCKPGWLTEPSCDNQCPSGTYGTDCTKNCSVHCVDHCDNEKGHCTCGEGYQGPTCTEALSQTSGESVTGIAVGISAAVFVVAVIVIVAVIVVRRRGLWPHRHAKSGRNQRDNYSEDAPFSEFANSRTEGRDTPSNAKPRATVEPQIRHPNSDPTYSNVPASSTEQESSAHLYGNISSAASGSSSSASPKRSAATGSRSKSNRHEDEIPNEEEDVYNNEDLYACYSSLASMSVVDTFQKYLLDCLASREKITTEFENFVKEMPHPHDVGSQPANNKKNRFKKLCAYDKNRVVLKRPEGDPETDYINASYIKGYGNDSAYIATQGPRPNTVTHLWWMVWQEDVTQIVMLTNLKEDGKNKCEQYWPALGKTVRYGHVTVTSQEEIERADFVIRSFVLKVEGSSGQPHQVHQYHYMAWPDHGVPAAGSLVNFWRYVTARSSHTALPVVHCSAGVGRTGTYIALDIAINKKLRGLDVSVNDIVTELREQRSIMVQTEVQYKFLHEVTLEAYTSRDTRLTLQQLNSKLPTEINVTKPNETIDSEFKMLTEMRKWAKPHNETAKEEENKHKNRDPNVLPDDNHMAYLSVYIRGRNQYINAVYMSSFKVKNGMLLTQLPLPDTLVDLWRLVEGCGVNTIVSLGGQDDEDTVKSYCRYWPQTVGEVRTTGPYKLSLKSANALSEQLTSFHVMVENKDSSRLVKMLRYTDWSGDLPGSTSSLIQLLEVLKTTAENDGSPVIIQCLDGATRSGPFCVLYDVMNRMMYDNEIDVFSTVRRIHSIRPQAVASEVQYRFCYKAAQEMNHHLNVYQNA